MSTAADSPTSPLPLVLVIGSINADIYLEIPQLPLRGETISAHPNSGAVKPGGKGANTAVSVALALGDTSVAQCAMVGHVGTDTLGPPLIAALDDSGVDTTLVTAVDGPTGSAYILLQDGGENSIIIVGGANQSGWLTSGEGAGGGGRDGGLDSALVSRIRQAKCVLLQREIPDAVNGAVIGHARANKVPVLLDLGGADSPLPADWLPALFCLAPNETELARITRMKCDTSEEIAAAARTLTEKGVRYVLVSRGAAGASIFTHTGAVIHQPAFATNVVDTTGAGDCLRGAFAAELVRCAGRKSLSDALVGDGDDGREAVTLQRCLNFASAAAALACAAKGAMEAMPQRASVVAKMQQAKVE